jgi:hypothetical protein
MSFTNPLKILDELDCLVAQDKQKVVIQKSSLIWRERRLVITGEGRYPESFFARIPAIPMVTSV